MSKEEKSPKTLPPRCTYRKNLSDAYVNYRNERKRIGYKTHPTAKQYKDFIRFFFYEMYLAIIFEDYTWFTPIGTFTVKARKRKNLKFAWIKAFDEATGQWIFKRKLPCYIRKYSYKFKWIKEPDFPRNIKFYTFKLINGFTKDDGRYLGNDGLRRRIVEASKDWRKSLPVVK